MLLSPKVAHGVADGSLTLAFRRWRRADVAVGSEFRTVAVGRERDPVKIDVRKLKNLVLTQSFDVGYDVSPRGAAYLARTTRPVPEPPRIDDGP